MNSMPTPEPTFVNYPHGLSLLNDAKENIASYSVKGSLADRFALDFLSSSEDDVHVPTEAAPLERRTPGHGRPRPVIHSMDRVKEINLSQLRHQRAAAAICSDVLAPFYKSRPFDYLTYLSAEF